jgi:hypothetical protein
VVVASVFGTCVADPAPTRPAACTSGRSYGSQRFASVIQASRKRVKVLALVIIVRFFGQSRHSSGRFPSGVALLHIVGSVLASRKTYYTAVGSRRTQLLLSCLLLPPR